MDKMTTCFCWEYCKDKETGSSALVVYDGDRFGVTFDVPMPTVSSADAILNRSFKQEFPKLESPRHVAYELLRIYVNEKEAQCQESQ